MLSRGKESMLIQPNTMVSIASSGLFERKTLVTQQTGTIDFEIETKGRPHTTVHTPFLAAVVKGTGFRVSIGKTSAKVSVSHGLVNVTSSKTGEAADVGPGQTATASAAKGLSTGSTKTGSAPSDTSSSTSDSSSSNTGNGSANSTGSDNSNSGGNAGSNGNGNGNAGGNGNGNGNAGGNGNGNGNAGGNGNGNGNSK